MGNSFTIVFDHHTGDVRDKLDGIDKRLLQARHVHACAS